MSTVVSISGTDYNLPSAGQSPPWGADLADIITALVAVANTVSGSADIINTSFTIANNTAVASNVTGAAFDTSLVRAFILQYSIYRYSTTTEMSEVGTLYGAYKSSAGSWELAQTYAGSSGVTFTITAGGQLKYVSTSFSGSSYSGKMKFSAKAYLQT